MPLSKDQYAAEIIRSLRESSLATDEELSLVHELLVA
jgi:hypothetical protein